MQEVWGDATFMQFTQTIAKESITLEMYVYIGG